MFEEIWKILSRIEESEYKKTILLANMRLYEKVLEYLKDSEKILEVGCGKGYGTFLLAKNLPGCKVVGIDIDEEVIEFDKRTWNSKNLTFEVMDILDSDSIEKIKREYKRLDAVVCLEVLEHISSDNTADFLGNIRYLIDEGGVLFLSTPNKRVYDIDASTEGHINEMNYEELVILFEKNDFKITSTFGIFSLNRFALHLLLKLNLAHHKGNESINNSILRRLLRSFIIFIFNPNRTYSEFLRRINKGKWMRYKYKIANLRNKEIQNSFALLFILKKK